MNRDRVIASACALVVALAFASPVPAGWRCDGPAIDGLEWNQGRLGWRGIHPGATRAQVESVVDGPVEFNRRDGLIGPEEFRLRALHGGLQINLYFAGPGPEAPLAWMAVPLTGPAADCGRLTIDFAITDREPMLVRKLPPPGLMECETCAFGYTTWGEADPVLVVVPHERLLLGAAWWFDE